MTTRKKYPKEFKLDAISLVLEQKYKLSGSPILSQENMPWPAFPKHFRFSSKTTKRAPTKSIEI